MQITERRSGGVVILEFSGRLVLGDGDRQAKEKITTLLAAGEREVLIGMAGVKVLDPTGVGELVAAHNAAASVGARIGLAQLSPRVSELFRIAQLIGVLEIFDSLEEGLSSFS